MGQLVKEFQLLFPELVKEMKASDHHYSEKHISGVHIEGDVWTHSQMVNLMAEQRNSNLAVKIACLLHDVGKPMSRTVADEKQRARFFNHDGMSVFIGLDFLNKLSISREDKIRVCELISIHTYLHRTMKTDPEFAKTIAETFSGQVSLLEDLIELSACDILGRFMDEEDRDLWNNSRDTLSYLLYKTNPHRYPRQTKGEAVVLVGPPMSGKSSWVKANAKNHLVLSRDEFILSLGKTQNYNDAFLTVDQDKVNKEYDALKREALKSGKDLVFDLTHMTEKSRRRSLAGLPKDMKRKAVVFLVGYKTLLARNKDRSTKENKNINFHTLKNMMGNFAVPLYSEGFDEIEFIFEEDQS